MDRFDEALQMALKKLAKRDRFAGEIRATLAGFEPDTIERVVVHLQDKGILNDRRLAMSIAEKLQANPAKLRADLERRGAPDEVVAECLSGAMADEDRAAFDALASKFDPSVPRPKAGRFLAARGFGDDAIESALDRFLQA